MQTIYADEAGKLAAIVDRTGVAWARLAWDGDRLASLEVPGATVIGAVIRDPLLGDAHAIRGAQPTAMSALDWARPTEIPTIVAPGRLAPGAGGALLNAIAVLAARGGVSALRYAGPYPTPALWRALLRSFRTTGDPAEFTADVLGRAARVARDPIAIDFEPAPCELAAVLGGHVELRDGLERAVLDGIAYERGGSPARLVEDRAELWFGDAPYATIATFAPDGTLADGPHPPPACTSEVIGREFPPALVLALSALIADAVPGPLAGDVQQWIATRAIRWADLGARTARAEPGALLVHAALWDRIGPYGLGRLALALAEALAPVAVGAVVAAVTSEQARS